MKYPAEIAAEAMEKKGIAFTTAALLALAAAPTITRGLNWLTGYDAKKKVQQSQAAAAAAEAAKAKQGQPRAGLVPGTTPPQMPQMPYGMLATAGGLHHYRAGQPAAQSMGV